MITKRFLCSSFFVASALAACSSSTCPDNAREIDGVCVADDEKGIETSDAGEDAATLPADGGGTTTTSRDAAPIVRDPSPTFDTTKDAAIADGDADAGTSAEPVDAATPDAALESDAAVDAAPPDPCLGVTCGANASCSATSGQAVCTCNAGYEGDGTQCIRNVCVSLGGEPAYCGANATCTFTPNPSAGTGSAACACTTGFSDCDAIRASGCEVDLASPKNCGACGKACAGSLGCSAGVCDQAAIGISAGADMSCALLGPAGASEVSCWGANTLGTYDYRTLGVPTLTASHANKPQLLPNLVVRSISGGGYHTCAVHADSDTVSCWGQSSEALGTTTTVAPGTRIAIGMPGVIEVAVGQQFACAMLQSGKVRCWGANNQSQLSGGGSATWSATPVEALLGAQAAVDIAAAALNACVVTKTGLAMCWGAGFGQNPGAMSSTLSPSVAITDAVQVALGYDPHAYYGQQSLGCVLRKSGEVGCFGVRTNDPTQLIDPNLPFKLKPVAGVPAGVKQIAVGFSHVCMLTTAGAVYCAGDPNYGALGFPGNTEVTLATKVPGVSDAIEIVAGGRHTCIRRASGQVQCWGRNTRGEVGDGTLILRSAPTNVFGLP